MLKCRADFGPNFEQTRKKRMHSPWVQNHLPKKSCTKSLTFSDFLGRNRNFVGENRNFVRDFLKNLPWNITNEGLFFYEKSRWFIWRSSDYKKTCKIPEKNSPNLCSQALWESPNSQQLFLNPNLGVKWRGKDCENIDIVMAESTENLLLLFALIDH